MTPSRHPDTGPGTQPKHEYHRCQHQTQQNHLRLAEGVIIVAEYAVELLNGEG